MKNALHDQISSIRDAMSAVHAYQLKWLGSVRKVPSAEDMVAVLGTLRVEASKGGLRGDDIGTFIAREKIAAEAYIGLLDTLRDGLVQAVQRKEKA